MHLVVQIQTKLDQRWSRIEAYVHLGIGKNNKGKSEKKY